MQKKAVYLNAMVQRVDDLRTRLLASPALSNVPAEQMKKDLEHEQTLLLDQQERLESRMRELPDGDEFSLVRRSMEAEKTSLIALQNDVAKRIRALSNVDKAQQEATLISSSEDLAPRVDQLERIWQNERNRAVRARAAWVNYYLDLERAIEGKKGVKTKPSKRPASELELPALPDISLKTTSAAVTRPDGRLDEFAGRWHYQSQPGAWVGFDEPLEVTLELHKEGTELLGYYVAVLPEPENKRRLDLALRGQAIGRHAINANWTSQDPEAWGQMRLAISADRRLLVERVYSNDSYIPLGMEVLVPD